MWSWVKRRAERISARSPMRHGNATNWSNQTNLLAYRPTYHTLNDLR